MVTKVEAIKRSFGEAGYRHPDTGDGVLPRMLFWNVVSPDGQLLLSRRGRSSPASASDVDTHRDSVAGRFVPQGAGHPGAGGGAAGRWDRESAAALVVMGAGDATTG